MTQLIEKAVALLRDGQLVAFPTETVYGLGADADNPEAVAHIFRVKERPPTVPLTVHLGTNLDPNQWAYVSNEAQCLMEQFWPGPLTLILPKRERVIDIVVANGPTVGLRMPSHPLCVALLNAFGSGVAAPSANRHHHLSPTSAEHVHQDFGRSLPLILDGGTCEVGLESTVLSLADDRPQILRQGAISALRIEEALSRPIHVLHNSKPNYTHQVQIRVLPRSEWAEWVGRHDTVTIISNRPIDDIRAQWVQMPDEPTAYQQKLFGILRQLNTAEQELILIEPVPDEPAWQAIRNRLNRVNAP